MIHDFRLPDIGEGLSEAELMQWLVGVGDDIGEGDDVATISTDKVNVDLPSPRAGVVAELPWEVGDIIPVGDVLMRIDDGKDVAPETDSGAADEAPERAMPVRPAPAGVKAAPALRRYAAEKGVELADVTPSGPDGQLLRADIDALLAGAESTGGAERFTLSGARLAASKRLAESSRVLATATQSFEVFADAILAETQRLSAQAGKEGPNVTPLAVIARCVSAVLARHRKFNATLDAGGDALLMHEEVNLGIAVDTPAGLMVPVVRDVASMDSMALATAIADVAGRARADRLKLEDVRGATFTITSTGGLERATLTATTPVINLPNIATLWVSRIGDRPRAVSGELEVGPVMACTLAFDHRYIDGAEGIGFINDLNDAFENA